MTLKFKVTITKVASFKTTRNAIISHRVTAVQNIVAKSAIIRKLPYIICLEID
jgi:hypothetical protein